MVSIPSLCFIISELNFQDQSLTEKRVTPCVDSQLDERRYRCVFLFNSSCIFQEHLQFLLELDKQVLDDDPRWCFV